MSDFRSFRPRSLHGIKSDFPVFRPGQHRNGDRYAVKIRPTVSGVGGQNRRFRLHGIKSDFPIFRPSADRVRRRCRAVRSGVVAGHPGRGCRLSLTAGRARPGAGIPLGSGHTADVPDAASSSDKYAVISSGGKELPGLPQGLSGPFQLPAGGIKHGPVRGQPCQLRRGQNLLSVEALPRRKPGRCTGGAPSAPAARPAAPSLSLRDAVQTLEVGGAEGERLFREGLVGDAVARLGAVHLHLGKGAGEGAVCL